MKQTLFSFVLHNSYACLKTTPHRHPPTPFMLAWVHYKMQEKDKNRCGRDKVSFCFCFISRNHEYEFNSIHFTSGTLAMPLVWRVAGRKDTAVFDRFRSDLPVCFFAYLQGLFNFEEAFLLEWKMNVWCGVFYVEQCQQSNFIPSNGKPNHSVGIFQVLIVLLLCYQVLKLKQN